MKVGLAQVDQVVADLEGNVGRAVAAVEAAAAAGAELVLLPELAVPGTPARDILLDPGFVAAAAEATADLARRTRGGPPVVAGTVLASEPTTSHPGLRNAAVLLRDGAVVEVASKRLLAAEDVFHEPRWFVPGGPSVAFEVGGSRIGAVLASDLERGQRPRSRLAELERAGVDVVVALAADPYRPGAFEARLASAGRSSLPVVLVNAVGGNDEVVFDGRSFATRPGVGLVAAAAAFAEDVVVADLEARAPAPPTRLGPEEELYRALVLGVRDFVEKNRIRRAFLGLSGGIDSALVAVIAADALGPGRVTAVAMPSRYTDLRSTLAARELAAALGIGLEVVEIEPLHRSAEALLGDLVAAGTAAENLQARIRALVLMAFVNRRGGILLNTSNKTEVSLGYGTLYGDLAGGLCPIADLTKPQVYGLSRWIAATRGLIPAFALERPPSAELAPGQVDPFDYDVVAPAVEELVRSGRSDAALCRSEHKRWQLGVVLKVSDKAFGSGRLVPITRR